MHLLHFFRHHLVPLSFHKVEISNCRNNLLLWLGDGELPEIYAGAPSCFQVVSGAEAKEIWANAKKRWIATNNGVARFTSDLGQ